MKHIQLTANTEEANSIEVCVSDFVYKSITQIQYSGGFLRFNIALIEDGLKGKTKRSDNDKLHSFLDSVFVKPKDKTEHQFDNNHVQTAIERHRNTWEGKSDEWLFERLDNELKQKVEQIHQLLETIKKLEARKHINLTIHVNGSDILTIHNEYSHPFDFEFSNNNKATLHKPFQVLKEITMDEVQELLKDNRWKPITNSFITIKTN